MWAHLYHCYGLFWDKRTKLSLMLLVKPEFFLWLHVKVLWKQKACSGGGMINSSYFIQIYVFRSHHSVISVQFIECKDLCRLLKLTFPETSIPYVGSYLYKMSNFKQSNSWTIEMNEHELTAWCISFTAHLYIEWSSQGEVQSVIRRSATEVMTESVKTRTTVMTFLSFAVFWILFIFLHVNPQNVTCGL